MLWPAKAVTCFWRVDECGRVHADFFAWAGGGARRRKIRIVVVINTTQGTIDDFYPFEPPEVPRAPNGPHAARRRRPAALRPHNLYREGWHQTTINNNKTAITTRPRNTRTAPCPRG